MRKTKKDREAEIEKAVDEMVKGWCYGTKGVSILEFEEVLESFIKRVKSRLKIA